MPEPNEPPPRNTLFAAAAGGFIGAVAGVVAATALTGDGDTGETQMDVGVQQDRVEVVEERVAAR